MTVASHLIRTPAQQSAPSPLRLLLIGVDHRCAPLEVREKVAYNSEEASDLLHRLVATPEISEACLLSTCNRTEIYVQPEDPSAAYRAGMEMALLTRSPDLEKEGRFFVKRDYLAARHLLEVASGLQSMVLGEPEILGQVKHATGLAEAIGATGTVLQKLLRIAIAAGGRARFETRIGSGAVSFGYVVVDLARNIFQRLENCAVLLIGAGEMARQVARGFAESGTPEILVANRSPQRAEELCRVIRRAKIVPFDERGQAAARCDVVVASTAAEEPILTAAHLKAAMRQRPGRPLLVADLGVPRNVDPTSGKLENVFLQDIDSLELLITRNLKRRREAVPKVQEILDRELDLFAAWHRGLTAQPIVTALQKFAEGIRRQELEAARRRFPDETHDQLDKLTRALVRKILHHPSAQLRQSDGQDPAKLDLVRELFRLDEEPT